MRWLTETDLAGIYGQPSAPSLDKVADCLVPDYRIFVEKSRFCILSTVGPEGIDASPRPDAGGALSGVDDSAGLPTAGQMLARLSGGQTGGTDYDREWPVRAAKTMW